MFKEIAKKILDLADVQISKKYTPPKVVFSEKDKPLLIEFIGIPGSGKSYLYQKLRKKSAQWISIEEFKKLQSHTPKITELDFPEIYQKMAEYRMRTVLNQPISYLDRFRGIHWNYKTIMDDIMLCKLIKNQTVLYEEGILHTFFDFFLENDFDTTVFKNRAVIYCHATPQQIANRIETRLETTGRIIAHHKNKTYEELVEINTFDLKRMELFLKLLKENQAPCLEINTFEDLNKNLDLIYKFIQKQF